VTGKRNLGDPSSRGMPSELDEGTADAKVLAEQLGELAYRDTEELLSEVVQAAARLIPGVDDASISVVRDRREVSSRLPTGDLPVRVDAIQNHTGQGPCLDSMYDQRTVRVSDMGHDPRWPQFAAQAAEAGAASMLSIQLWVEGDNLGALNLYSRRVDAFDDESEQVAAVRQPRRARVRQRSEYEPHGGGGSDPGSDRPGEGSLDGAVQGHPGAGLPDVGQGQQREQPGAALGRGESGLDRPVDGNRAHLLRPNVAFVYRR
jgi:hypothetical protein